MCISNFAQKNKALSFNLNNSPENDSDRSIEIKDAFCQQCLQDFDQNKAIMLSCNEAHLIHGACLRKIRSKENPEILICPKCQF